MKTLCKLFGHAYRPDCVRREHYASNTVHWETWNVCKRCKFSHKVKTDRVQHAADVIRGM